tara:strand:+ start:2568 stop:3461 length:894 start_codon:yes stop_codon:yes gene_type:complete
MGKLSKLAKALDTSKKARMERAREAGFDTETVYYHGSPDARGIWEKGFSKKGSHGFGEDSPLFFSSDDWMAKTYADDTRAFDLQNAVPETIPVHLKTGNPKRIDWGGKDFRGKTSDGKRYDVRSEIDKAIDEDFDSVIINNIRDSYNKQSKAGNVTVVLDPSSVRSVNAAFDPTKKESSNLLAGTAAAMIGAGSLLSGEQAAASDFYQRRVAKKPKWQAMRDRSNAETTDRLGQAAPVEHEALADLASKFATYNRWVKSKPGLDFILPEAPTELVDKWSYGQPTTLADDAEAALGLL